MEINKNNWHAKFYYWTYGEYPDSLCPYFWKLIIALVLLPLTFVGYLIPMIREDDSIFGKVSVTLLFYLTLFFGISMGTLTPINNVFIAGVVGCLLLVIVTVLAAVILFGTVYFFAEWLPERRRSKEPKTNLVKERIRAFKGKYCPKIEWKN